jgi:hypothetical protein
MLRFGRLACVALVAATFAAATASAENSKAQPSAAALDLRSVNWSSVTLPAVCGGSKPIKLHRPPTDADKTDDAGTALITPIPRRWSGYWFDGSLSVEVDASGPLVYGDLAGSGHDDAGLLFDCNNGSGTADGALLWGWAIFSGTADKLTVVGVVTPRVQPAGVGATHLDIAIQPGKIIAYEDVYGPYDPTAGGSGRATTVWTYSHGQLRPGRPVITRRPCVPPGVVRCQTQR